jgi:hypothetical protein
MDSPRVRLTILAALLAALLAPSAATAAWGPTQDMGPLTGEFVYDGNARGDRILVWRVPEGFAFAQARPGEQLGAPRVLPRDPDRTEFAPRVEIDERGNALLVWTYFDETDPEFEVRGPGPCCDGLRARVIRRDGTFTPPKTLAKAGNEVRLSDMQIAPNGTFGIVFTRSSYTSAARGVDARFGTIARGFGPRENVFRDAALGPFGLSFVSGRARLLYATGAESYYTTTPTVMRELERRGKGRWRSLGTRLKRTPVNRERLRVATSSRGEQAVTWMREGKTPSYENQSVYAAVRAPGRAFRVRRIAVENYFQEAPLAIEPEGNVLTAWPSVRRVGIVTAARRPRAGFGALTRFAEIADRRQIGRIALDVNRRGHGLLAWSERPFDAGDLEARTRLVATFRNSRGSSLEHHVIEAEATDYTLSYAVTLDREGRGHVAYGAGGRLRVVAARIGG